MHAPTDSYWATVKRILCYLKGTTSYGFHIIRGTSFSLHGFIDASWAGGIDDRKSTSGVILFSLVRHLFHANPASNVQLPAPPLRLSIKP